MSAIRFRKGQTRSLRRSRRRAVGSFAWWILCVSLLVVSPLRALPAPPAPPAEAKVARIAYSASMFEGVNANDANAAIQVWIDAAVKEAGPDVRAETTLLEDRNEMRAGLVARRFDAGCASSAEFLLLEKEVALAPLFIGAVNGRDREEYVLLVHRDSRTKTIQDLAGRSLTIWKDVRTCLVDDWLRGLLDGKAADDHFGLISRNTKLSGVVLPVFFRQTDACVVTRIGWETMSELNPQVGLQLEAVSSSPEFVAIVLFFRADYSGLVKEKLVEALRHMHENPRGRQVLTLFRGDALKEASPEVLQTAREMQAGGAAGSPARKAPGSAVRTDRLAESTRTRGLP